MKGTGSSIHTCVWNPKRHNSLAEPAQVEFYHQIESVVETPRHVRARTNCYLPFFLFNVGSFIIRFSAWNKRKPAYFRSITARPDVNHSKRRTFASRTQVYGNHTPLPAQSANVLKGMQIAKAMLSFADTVPCYGRSVMSTKVCLNPPLPRLAVYVSVLPRQYSRPRQCRQASRRQRLTLRTTGPI